jgi:tetratricopeptide (TPR) repeat protein
MTGFAVLIPIIRTMDAATADRLLAAAQEARAAMRSGDDAAVDRLEARYPELREAMDWNLEQGRLDQADRLAAALVPFWIATKRIDEGQAWFEGAIPEPGTDARRARAEYDHGYLAFFAGHYDLAETRFADARRLASVTGDADVEALALAGSARVALIADPAEAVRLLREAIGVTADLPDSDGRSSANHVLGVALQMAGDLQGARDVMTERLDHARAAGNDFVVAVESANLSMVERKLGHLDAAEALSLEALRIVRRKHDEMAIPWVINGLAAVTAAQGRLERGATLTGAAESLLEQAGGEWPADEREQYDGAVAIVKAGLAPPAFDAARATGRAMSLDEAVTYAMADEGRAR